MKKQPLYQLIINDIKKDILAGKYKANQQIPTELELSDNYEVSRITSKRALTELENEGFIYRLRGKGSFVKERVHRQLADAKTDILFIMPFPKDIGFGNYTQGIFQSLENSPYRLVVQSHESLTPETLPQVINHYGGVIFYPVSRGRDLELLYSLYLNHVPTVILDKEYEGIDFTTIVADNQQGTYDATQHLFKTGLKKVAFVSTQQVTEVSTIRERYLGYLKALHENGSQQKFLYEGRSGKGTEAFIAEVVTQAQADGVEGFVAENDLVAIALVNYLKQEKVAIPAKFSVVGFDNIQASELIEPRLTTVAQNFTEMGYLACQKLMEQIENPQAAAEKLVVNVDFIERETTRAPNV